MQKKLRIGIRLLAKVINVFSKKLVEAKRDRQYLLVYLLLTLALILFVAIAFIKRVSLVMNIVKNSHNNRMRDQLLNASLVVYIEKYVFDYIKQCRDTTFSK